MAIANLEDWLNSSMSREHNGVYDDVKLEPVKRILDALDISIRPITVAGTKGKGSTLRFIEVGLIAAGKTCLAFTSPHVTSINERWRLSGQLTNDQALIQTAEKIAQAEIDTDIQLTYFERCFAIAADLAQDENVDYFLCEVGLGGRLDCANALDTQLAIVTAISKDHCKVLGDTLALISAEKLAIARKDAPLIIGPQSDAAEKAITQQLPAASKTIYVQCDESLQLQMHGKHQQGNASTALCALGELQIPLDTTVLQAIRNSTLPARCEIISAGHRNILIDAAHNGESIRACMEVAKQHLQADFQIIVGSMIDKQLDDICQELDTNRPIVRSAFDWPRACGASDWPAAANDWPFYAKVEDALAALDPEKDVCICGSFYLAGEALALLQAK